MKNVLVTIAILALGWGIRFGFNMITAEPYVELTDAEWAAEADDWIEESLSDGTAAPARGWLDDAEHVWMIDIVEFGGKEISDTVAAELPESGARREMVFAAEARLLGGEGTEDVGQRYLTFSFD